MALGVGTSLDILKGVSPPGIKAGACSGSNEGNLAFPFIFKGT